MEEIKTQLDLLNAFLKENDLRVKWENFCQDNGMHVVNGFGVKRVYVTQDEDSHWYVIPYELKELFEDLTAPFGYPSDSLTDEEMDELYEERGRREEVFDKEFSKYATGGDINNIELYAKI